MTVNGAIAREVLTLAEAKALDAVCDQFEDELRNGQQPLIESRLDGWRAEARPVVLRELLELEVVYSRRRGESFDMQALRQRFPECDKVLTFVHQQSTEPDDGPAIHEVNQVVGERFQIETEVGRGAFGSVYRAVDQKLQRTVALKITHDYRPTSGRELREACVAARLSHPNIVTVFDVGELEGRWFIASEFVEGTTVGAVLKDDRRFSHEESARLLARIAGALHYAHTMGIVHRDIKPDNVILDSSDEPHITDFGLARQLDADTRETREGVFLGTPAYSSPEQARSGAAADARSDQWSLGVIMFELLTGQRPFQGNALEIFSALSSQDVPHLRQFDRRVPRDLETICLKCLANDPACRYADCQALASDLESWLRRDPIQARRASTIDRVARWSRRNPVAATLVVVLMAVLLAAGVIYQQMDARAKQRQAELAQERERNTAVRYAGNMIRAENDWADGRTDRVLQHLSPFADSGDGQSDPRGWEWFYQWRLCNQHIRSFAAHIGAVTALSFSPNSAFVLSAGQDGRVCLWQTATGEEQWQIELADASVTSACFEPAGETVFVADSSGRLSVFDHTGKRLDAIKPHESAITALAISRDGKWLATAGEDRHVKLLQADDYAEVWSIEPRDPIMDLAFSPFGETLAGASAGYIEIWDRLTGHRSRPWHGHNDAVASIAFHPYRDALVSASFDGTARMWDVALGRQEQVADHHRGRVRDVAFFPDGNQWVSGGDDHSVRVWDESDAHLVRTLAGHTSAVTRVATSDDGLYIASADESGSIKVWDRFSGQESWDLSTGSARIDDCEFLPGQNGQARLVTGNSQAEVFLSDSKVYDSLQTWQAPAGGGIRCLAATTDGQWLATAGELYRMLLWDVISGGVAQEFELPKGHGALSVAFDPSDEFVVAGTTAGFIYVWNVKTSQLFQSWKGHDQSINVAMFDPRGALVTGSSDQTVKFWNHDTGSLRRSLSHSSSVHSVCRGSDPDVLFVGLDDGTIVMWNTATGQRLQTLDSKADSVLDLALHPDGTRLASAHMAGAVKIWDIKAGYELRSLNHGRECLGLAFSPDGQLLASVGDKGRVKIWDARRQGVNERLEREAYGLARSLLDLPLPRGVVQQEIEDFPAIDEPVRRKALELLPRLAGDCSPDQLYQAAWGTIRRPFLAQAQYQIARLQAAAAVQATPQNPAYQSALAAAEYHVGESESADERLANLNEDAPAADQLFVAMALYRSGQAQKAQERLKAIREQVTASQVDPPLRSLLAKAHLLIGGTPWPEPSRLNDEPNKWSDRRFNEAEQLHFTPGEATVTEGCLLSPADFDYYRVTVLAKGELRIVVTPTDGLKTVLKRFVDRDADGDGAPDGEDRDVSSDDGVTEFTFRAQAGQTHFFRVGSHTDTAGRYKLRLGPPDSDSD